MSHTDARYRFEEISPLAKLFCIMHLEREASEEWNNPAPRFVMAIFGLAYYKLDNLAIVYQIHK